MCVCWCKPMPSEDFQNQCKCASWKDGAAELFHPPPLAVACQAGMKQMVSGDAYTEWVRNFKVDMRNAFHIVYAWSLSVV